MDREAWWATVQVVAKESDKKVSDFNGCFSKYPQVLINVKTTAEGKAFYKTDEYIEGFIEAKQQQLMGLGRVLVRLSGTEPLIRVMKIAKDVGCIFTFGTDTHSLAGMDAIRKGDDISRIVGITEADLADIVK